MEITKDKLAEIARDFATKLNFEGINSLETAQSHLSPIQIREGEPDHIIIIWDHTINWGPTIRDRADFNMFYVIPGSGIPLDVQINTKKAYINFNIKCQEQIRGYEPFPFPHHQDHFENLVQTKRTGFDSWTEVTDELNFLAGRQ